MEHTEKKIRAALYMRVACEDKESILLQKKQLEQYAAAHNMLVAGSWADQASGLTLNRPGLSGLTEAVADGTIDAVLTMGIDRIGRGPKVTFNYLDFLNLHGVHLVTVKNGPVDVEIHRALLAAMKK